MAKSCASCEYLGVNQFAKCAICLKTMLWTDIFGGTRCKDYEKFDPYSKRKKVYSGKDK